MCLGVEDESALYLPIFLFGEGVDFTAGVILVDFNALELAAILVDEETYLVIALGGTGLEVDDGSAIVLGTNIFRTEVVVVVSHETSGVQQVHAVVLLDAADGDLFGFLIPIPDSFAIADNFLLGGDDAVFTAQILDLGLALEGLFLLTVESCHLHCETDVVEFLDGFLQHCGGILIETALRVVGDLSGSRGER